MQPPPAASMGPRPDGRGRLIPGFCPPNGVGVNGAATGWPRKGRRPRHRRQTETSVNGAATGWPRKVVAAQPPGEACRRASMGPRPDGRGRSPPSARAARGSGVNGAATGWPRKAPMGPGRGRSGPASMGPRPDGRGRARGRTGSRGGRRGVNGAATGWPRKAYSPPRTGAPPLASMGPRPDGRGRLETASRFDPLLTSVNGAATGWPRKGAIRPSSRAPPCCVNGAATGWPRKVDSARKNARQRGRVNGAATGWPRKAVGQVYRPFDHVASMGPRPDGRGRLMCRSLIFPASLRVNGAATGWPRKAPLSCMLSNAPLPRQWGRDRMAAEGVDAGNSYQTRKSRQWGRDRMAAEGRHRPPSGCTGSCVNGAATGWPRKALHWRSCWGSARRVNGAATGWPRKAVRRGDPEPEVRTRQWGRDRMAAEGHEFAYHKDVLDARQWGRDRMAAEGAFAGAGRACRMSVNGAATGWPRKAT